MRQASLVTCFHSCFGSISVSIGWLTMGLPAAPAEASRMLRPASILRPSAVSWKPMPSVTFLTSFFLSLMSKTFTWPPCAKMSWPLSLTAMPPKRSLPSGSSMARPSKPS